MDLDLITPAAVVALLTIIVWGILALAAGYYAERKGRSAGGWALVALLFSPLLAFLFLAVLTPMEKDDPALKQCPFCAERIRREAKICRFCNRELMSEQGAELAHTK